MILLDLRKGRYLGVKSEQARSLANQVSGWPSPFGPGDGGDHANASAPSPALTAKLVAQGILSTERQASAAPARFAAPDRSFADEASSGASVLSAASLLNFLAAATRTSILLRLRSMEAIAAMVSTRRQRATTRVAQTTHAVRHSLGDAVSTYLRLRPALFTVRDKCLFDSLALLEFLAAEGFHPHWCIGVRTQPFAAHSWVQIDNLVLNDDHEHVRSYRLILCV